MDWLFYIPERLVAFFQGIMDSLQGLVPIAQDFGQFATALLVITAPFFIAYGISKMVSNHIAKSMGYWDALITTGMFAIAAGGGLGSILGAMAVSGGMAVIVGALWTILTALGFLLGVRTALGITPAIIIAGAIPALACILGMTVYVA